MWLKALKTVAANLFFVIGLCMSVYGVSLVHVPTSIILSGFTICLLAFGLHRQITQAEE